MATNDGDPKKDASPSNGKSAGKEADAKAPSRTIDLDAKDVTEKKADNTTKPDPSKTGSAKPNVEAASKPAKSGSNPAPSAAKVTPPSSQPAAKKSGNGLMGGVFGGVIGAALMYGASMFGLIPGGNSEQAAQTTMSITSLEQSVEGLRDEIVAMPTVSPDDLAALKSELDTLAEASAQPNESEGLGEVMASLEALRADMDALSAAPASEAESEAVSALAGEVEALKSALAGQPAGTDGNGAIAAISADLAGLKSQVETLQSAESSAVDSIDLSPLTARIDALEAGSGTDLGGEADNLMPALDELGTRLDAVETGLNALAESSASAGSSEAFDALAAKVATVETAVGELSGTLQSGLEAANAAIGEASSAGVDLGPLEAQIASVGETATEAAATAAAASESVTALEVQVGDLAGQIEEVSASAQTGGGERQAATLVALAGLQRAAQGSGPFETELEAVKSIGGESALTSALEPFAASGVPDLRSISLGFSDNMTAILEEAAKAESDSVMGRLSASAQSLVRIRPTGFVAGDSPSAKVARVEALLSEGKLAAALEEWDTLGDAAKAASAGWADTARQRMALDQALAGGSAPATN